MVKRNTFSVVEKNSEGITCLVVIVVKSQHKLMGLAAMVFF